MITKEKIIASITARIKSEYAKHLEMDWAEIAAQKIYLDLLLAKVIKNEPEF